MKKILLIAILLSLILMPLLTNAAIVTCGNSGQNPCGIGDFFGMLGRIYDFVVKSIAAPLAIIALVIGGIMILISGGNPGLATKGKQAIMFAIIGLVLAFGSYIIIKTLLSALGYKY